MSNTFFKEIQPHIYRGETLTEAEFKELAKKLDEIGEKYAEDKDLGDGGVDELGEEFVFYDVPLDEYYLSANPINVLCEREHLVKLHKNDVDYVFVPDFLLEKPKLLKKLYDGVIINDKVYSRAHPRIVQTADTNNYIFKEDAYDVMGYGYFEKKDDIVTIGDDGRRWAREKDTVITEDMGYRWFKSDCYEYYNDNDEVVYYRFRSLAPNAGRKIMRFEEAQFPNPDQIAEPRIGIELEYKTAVDASVAVLTNKQLRSNWNSVRDGSLEPDEIPRDQEKATEFVSVPFRIGELGKVSDFMKFVKERGATVDERCGYHVHIGSPDLDFDKLAKIVTLCQNLEKDLFRLVPDHRQNNEYCKRLDHSFKGFSDYVNGDVKTEEEVADMFYEGKASAKTRAMQGKWNVRGKRHFWLSVDRFWYCKDEPHKRTIEFRMHHATHDADKFLEFVLLCYYITQFGLTKPAEQCKVATLDNVVDSIQNQTHYYAVKNLLQSKKVLS